MKYFVAVILVVVAVASAEPPLRDRGFLARQSQQQAYQARGVRPAGAQFNNYPLRSQRQQLPPTPAASYGPPAQEYGPPATTTELPITTETIQTTTVEVQETKNLRQVSTKDKLINAAEKQETQSVNPASLYVVVPQAQNFVYAPSAKLVTAPVQQQRLIPIQAIPAFAKIQEVPQFAQLVDAQFANLATVSAVPAVSSAYTSYVSTPYSSTFVQSFQ